MTAQEVRDRVALVQAVGADVIVMDDVGRLRYRVTMSFDIPYEFLDEVFPTHTGPWSIDQIRELLPEQDRRLRLVKEERERTGCGLKEAMERVQARGWTSRVFLDSPGVWLPRWRTSSGTPC